MANPRHHQQGKGGKMSKKELFELQDCLDSAMTLVDKYQKLIDPLLDPYFRGLSSPEIAELAKKSIRLTAENRRLEEALEEIEVTTNKAVDLPCVFSCDCNNCAEKPTKNGDTCIQGAIFKIADIIKKVKN